MSDKKRLIKEMHYVSQELDDLAFLICKIFGKKSYQCHDARKQAALMRMKRNIFEKEFEDEI